jgi:4a-hydroxytetrahydrobiopterin dehydratase
MSIDLADKKCVPCRGGVPPLSHDEIQPLMERVNGWTVEADKKLIKTYKFKDFMGPMGFANRIAEIAEGEGHHPDLYVAWGKVEVFIWTHKVDGLTESDFILAAKIDRAFDGLGR